MLSALRSGRFNLLPQGDNSDTQFCQRLSRPRSHGVAESFGSRKNRRYLNGNTTRDLLSFQRSAPTNCDTAVPPCVPYPSLFAIHPTIQIV